MKNPRTNRRILTVAVFVATIGGLALGVWPGATSVDIGDISNGAIVVTIDEDARTQVSQPYVLSTPIAGRLLRVTLEPGDVVVEGETIVAHMLPANPAALDIRSREEARSAVTAAEAALNVNYFDLKSAIASDDVAQADLARAQELSASGTLSMAALEHAEANAKTAKAALETAEAAIAVREAEIESTRAHLIDFGDSTEDVSECAIPIYAPIDGRVLQVTQTSATTLEAGVPIMVFGNLERDLEVVAELLSTEAVQVSEGDRVIIEHWGGQTPLSGEVARIEPWGFTKTSALGVEEQRVNVTIALTDAPEARAGLGHGYRVGARIVIWETDDATVAPASALFRHDGGYAVYIVKNDRAELRTVELDRTNGLEASVISGLEPGDQVVLYPSPGLSVGDKIRERV